MEVAMSEARVPIHSPAPVPDGPIVCTLHPNEYAWRLEDFRQGVFTHLRGMERPEPSRLRLVRASPEATRGPLPANERPRIAARAAGPAGRGERPDPAILRTPRSAGSTANDSSPHREGRPR